MERLLCIKIASRGDLLLAAPAFRMLRERHPHARISLLVGISCEDVAQHLPYFDEIQTIDDHALMALGYGRRLCAAWHFFRLLKADGLSSQNGSYSEVFIFHRDWRYAFLAWLARIAIRHGFYSHKGRFFLTHSYRPEKQEHHVHQYLKMVFFRDNKPLVVSENAMAGNWRFNEGEKEQALARAAQDGFRATDGNWVALGFGGGRNVKTHTDLKTWPLDYYHRLASLLVEHGKQIVWIGDSEDAKTLGNPVVGINLAGKTTVAETAAILSVCSQVVANDTLILHLAGVMGVPVIGLFGPTDPAHYQPLGPHSTYLWIGEKLTCSPCHQDGYFPPCHFQHRCMKELSVESVFQKIMEIK